LSETFLIRRRNERDVIINSNGKSRKVPVFPHNLINGTIFGKKLCNIKLCFDFLYDFCVKQFLFLGEISDIIYINGKSRKVPVFPHNLISGTIFEKKKVMQHKILF